MALSIWGVEELSILLSPRDRRYSLFIFYADKATDNNSCSNQLQLEHQKENRKKKRKKEKEISNSSSYCCIVELWEDSPSMEAGRNMLSSSPSFPLRNHLRNGPSSSSSGESLNHTWNYCLISFSSLLPGKFSTKFQLWVFWNHSFSWTKQIVVWF